MTLLKLWAWRAIAAPALLVLLPLFAFMGEMVDFRRVWAEAMRERA